MKTDRDSAANVPKPSGISSELRGELDPSKLAFGPNFLHHGEPSGSDPTADRFATSFDDSINPHAYPFGPNFLHRGESDPDW
jgi:hypothetical protein